MASQNQQSTPAGDSSLGPDLAGPSYPSKTVHDRLKATGQGLASSLDAVIAALPETPRRPNALARDLGVNRAVASKVLSAMGKHEPLEVLHVIPGPEPLRKLVRAAGRKGVPSELIATAESAITAFDKLIRDEAGTRAALDALISSSLPGARDRFELSSKYAVYKGLSQLKGVQAEHWLGTAIVAPAADDPLKHNLTWLNGAVALQRLRPGAPVRFAYRYAKGKDAKGNDSAGNDSTGNNSAGNNSAGNDSQSHDNEGHEEAPLSVMPLDQFCLHPAAQLQIERAGEALHYTLPEDL
ncbi:MAG: hypothetical protein ACI9EF_001892, partial [Pseudohongiellaceae bacterium]